MSKKYKYPFRLVDTFNNTILSQHRTLETAAKAEIRFRRACKKANNGACVPTNVEYLGEKLDDEDREYYLSLLDRQV
jgi:hypothetical protein